MSQLAQKTCIPCKGGVPPLTGELIAPLADQLNDWTVVDNHHLHKAFTFPDFVHALAFVNKIGDVAEEQNHHPNISFTWGKVEVDIWTHKINGLTESDFVLAAKFDLAVTH